MEQALQLRLELRHKCLIDLTTKAKAMLDSDSGIPLIQLAQLCLQLKTAIEALDKESLTFVEKCGDMEGLAAQCTKDQMSAEEILASLEALGKVAATQEKIPEQGSRLPKLELMKFNGDVLKWTEYWDKFEANIDSRNLKEVDKLSYLLSTLGGAALETVEGLGATNANYVIAVDALRKRFGAKEKVVDAHYAALDKLKVAANIPSECRRNLNQIERHLRILETYEENIDSSHLRVTISSKFPGPVLYQVKLMSRDSKVMELRACLEKVIAAMEQSDEPTPSSSTSRVAEELTTEALHSVTKRQRRVFNRPKKRESRRINFTFNRKRNASTSQGPEEKRKKRECVFCKQEHFSNQCPKYTSLKERRGKMGNKCYICLKEGHRAATCPKVDTIKCYHCQGKHNTALCHKKVTVAASKSNIPHNVNSHTSYGFLTNVISYLQTATAQLVHNNKAVTCRLLLDSGSQRSYLTTKMAKLLDLTADTEDKLVIFTFGSTTPKEMSSPSAEVRLVTKRGIQKEIRVNLVPHITDRITVPEWNAEDINVDLCADDNSVGEGIDLLIGNDFYFSFIRNEHIKVQENLFLVNTDFGWIISGNYHLEQEGDILSIATYCQCHEPGCTYFTEPDLPLRTIDMRFLWALESIGITDSPKTTREEEAVRYFNETVIYKEGRYEVKWPWVDFPPELPTSFGLAFGRLKSMLRRSDAETIKNYEDILKEQLEAGIIEVAPQPSDKNVPVHYLPHHIVKQDGKRGRIVYDASAKTNEQKSLNECLYRGPSMIEDMTALILQFRTRKIGITADVEKAFLQVGLQESDREVTRFLWVKDPTKELSEDNLLQFRFCRVPFGIISSPFLLTATIRYHFARTNQPLLQKVADKCYVDNLVTNADSVSEAKQVYKETREAFGKLAMNIREWTSNSEEFIASIPEQQRTKNMDSVKVLGLLWDLKDDTLRLKLSDNMLQKDVLQVKTKKDVLRMLARFYDPCGFIAPLILPAKLLFQELCMKKIKWDTIMPEDLREKWNSIVKNIQTAKSVMLPRHAGGDKASKYELHAFSDASKNAYATVVYLRTTTGNETKVSFLMAKSRVTPAEDKQDLKIPRLELLGFLIGSRLLKYVRDNLDLPIQQAYLWTDSLIVLSWMKSSKLLPPFVSRRINEIKECKDVQFRYVNTYLNSADLATRPDLWQQKKDLWLNGPEFLTKQQECWPSITKVDERTALLSAGEALDAVDGPEMVEKGYEEHEDVDMMDVPVATDDPAPEAYQHENVDMVKLPESTEELSQSNDVIRKLQSEYFPDEVAGKQTHLTRNLGLFLDVDGLLRCKGRMSNTGWTYDKKHPILIPRKCDFTNEIVRSTHESNYHVGVAHTLSIIRQKYWIPQGRAEVERLIRKCPQCVKYGGGPYQLPPTPALPAERVNYSRPFTYTGIDYFGPMFVCTETGREKRWICLYTCLAVRAIHMEVVNNLTADECLLALRRFTATRGVPLKIVSDNALYFKLSSQVLSETYCKENKIQWKFIPALAPWHGAFYERLIAIVKHCLKRTIDKHLLQDAQLLTVIKEVESVVNSRPLVRVGTELEHVLKPSDFLSMGKCLEFNLEATSTGTATKIDLIQAWKRGQIILNEFRRMFEDQYLPSLRERYNNSYQQPRVKSHREPGLGDIVQIKDDSQKRCRWKVGKIVSLIQGRDGECRIAKVRVGDSEFTRSIGHLYPLETDVAPAREVISRTDTQHSEDTGSKTITETMESLEPILPELSNPEQPEARDASDLVERPVAMDEVVGKTDETAVADEVTPDGEKLLDRARCGDVSVEGEPTRKKRDAAIKAKERIAEWTRQLFVLL